MAVDENGNGRINVSRDLLRAELGALELRIVDRLTSEIAKKADQEDLRSLRHRVQTLEAQGPLGERLVAEFLEMKTTVDDIRTHGSPEAQEALRNVGTLSEKLDGMTAWRNRLVGAYALLLLALGALLPFVVQHYF